MGRRAIQPLVSPQAVQEHLPVAEVETTQLLHDIMHDPEVHIEFLSLSSPSQWAHVHGVGTLPSYLPLYVLIYHFSSVWKVFSHARLPGTHAF